MTNLLPFASYSAVPLTLNPPAETGGSSVIVLLVLKVLEGFGAVELSEGFAELLEGVGGAELSDGFGVVGLLEGLGAAELSGGFGVIGVSELSGGAAEVSGELVPSEFTAEPVSDELFTKPSELVLSDEPTDDPSAGLVSDERELSKESTLPTSAEPPSSPLFPPQPVSSRDNAVKTAKSVLFFM